MSITESLAQACYILQLTGAYLLQGGLSKIISRSTKFKTISTIMTRVCGGTVLNSINSFNSHNKSMEVSTITQRHRKHMELPRMYILSDYKSPEVSQAG